MNCKIINPKDHFQFIKQLCDGFCRQYHVKRITDGQEFILEKFQNLKKKELQICIEEVNKLMKIKHINLISYEEIFYEQESNTLLILKQYNNNCNLNQMIEQKKKNGILIEEYKIWDIFIQIVKGLKQLHDNNIYHYDLKSENIFINQDGIIKIGNIITRIFQDYQKKQPTGTPYFQSPEYWEDKIYDNKSDIWSIGCILYEMTTLTKPFISFDLEHLYQKIKKSEYQNISSSYSQNLNTMIRILLQVNGKLRPSCDEILQFQINNFSQFHSIQLNQEIENKQISNLHKITQKEKKRQLPQKKQLNTILCEIKK